MQNDSGGYENAHVQNVSENSYASSVCCGVDSGTLSTACTQSTVVKLSNTTNAHVQVGNYTGPGPVYNVSACLTASTGSISCTYASTCPAEYACLGSLASSNGTAHNNTDAHFGSCSQYTQKLCCVHSVNDTLPITLLNPDAGVNYNSNAQLVAFQYNVTNTSAIASCNLTLNSVLSNGTVTPNLTVGAVNTFSHSLTPGTYNWNVSCTSTTLTNTSETRSFTITAPSTGGGSTGSSTSSSSGGGGGGGGAEAPVAPVITTPSGGRVTISPAELSIQAIKGRTERREVLLDNAGPETLFALTVENLAHALSVPPQLVVSAREITPLSLTIHSLVEGLQTGHLLFTSGKYATRIPITLNVRTENFLFDTALTVAPQSKVLTSGEDLKVQVNLVQVGPRDKVDVHARYVLKDFNGKIYLDESETFYVLEAKDYIRTFRTDDLPEGTYILGLELSYPGAFATSSAQFEVRETKFGGIDPQTLLIGGVVVLVLSGCAGIVYVLVRRARLPIHLRQAHQKI